MSIDLRVRPPWPPHALNQLTISELTARLARREVSAREATQACLDQIQRVDGPGPRVHQPAMPPDALAQADAADQALAAGATHAQQPLLGVPIAIKDVIAVKAASRSTAARRFSAQFVSPYDATVDREAESRRGGVFGRLNMDEFAMGSSTENSGLRPHAQSVGPRRAFRAVPRAVRRRRSRRTNASPALGSDTGGSIRQPAALCGCVGLKPTYGRVSRYGLVAFASSLDQIGPLHQGRARRGHVLNVISGHDPRDSTSVPQPVPDYAAALTGDIKGLKLGPAEGIHDRRAGPGSEAGAWTPP